MTRILLTGFEPFGGESMNPSMEVVKRLAAMPPERIELHGEILPVDRDRAARQLFSRVEQVANKGDGVASLSMDCMARAVWSLFEVLRNDSSS